MNKFVLSMTMLLSVAPIISMTPSHKTTINTISCLTAFHAMQIDLATSAIVNENKKYHPEFLLPIYSSPIAPLLGSLAITACITNNNVTGLMLAQQSIQCAYIRRSFVNTAVENLVYRKNSAHKNNQLSTWISSKSK